MAEYDVNKQYKWDIKDEFVLDGNQFGLVLNALRSYLAKPEAQEVMLIIKSEAEMTNLLKKGVESDKVKEIAPKEQPEPLKKK